MRLNAVEVEFLGPGPAAHNMPCAVFHGNDGSTQEPAVFNCNTGVFRPSWVARERGFMLVKVPRWLQHLLRRWEA